MSRRELVSHSDVTKREVVSHFLLLNCPSTAPWHPAKSERLPHYSSCLGESHPIFVQDFICCRGGREGDDSGQTASVVLLLMQSLTNVASVLFISDDTSEVSTSFW